MLQTIKIHVKTKLTLEKVINQATVYAILIFYYTYFMLVKRTLSPMDCIELEKGSSYLNANLDVDCNSRSHQTYNGIILFCPITENRHRK